MQVGVGRKTGFEDWTRPAKVSPGRPSLIYAQTAPLSLVQSRHLEKYCHYLSQGETKEKGLEERMYVSLKINEQGVPIWHTGSTEWKAVHLQSQGSTMRSITCTF